MLQNIQRKVDNIRAIHEFFTMTGESFITVALDGIKNYNLKVNLIPHPDSGCIIRVKLLQEKRINDRSTITSQIINELTLPEKPTMEEVESLMIDKYSYLLKLKKMNKRTLINNGEISPIFQ